MARAQSSDLMHNFRFQVTDVKAGGGSFLGTADSRGDKFPQAGFNTCQTPAWTVESATYREGIWTYTKKFPGVPTVEAVEMTRGVAKAETALVKWILACIRGGEYRADVTISHFHRDNDKEPARRIFLREAFPTNFKSATDLDATSSDIAVTNLTLDFESFDIQVVGGESASANG